MSSIEIIIDENAGIVRVTPSKPVTVSEACAAIRDIINMPGFKKGLPSIWDLRHTELLHINAEDIKTISREASAHQEQRGEACIAFIVSSDLAYGLGRMFEMVNDTSHMKVRVFRNYEDGERWALNRD
ncbi:MAG: hypothetical protein AAF387_03260 [Pseudomonadota bacterium]